MQLFFPDLPRRTRFTRKGVAVAAAWLVEAMTPHPCDVWWQGRWIDRQAHPAGAKAWEMWLHHERAEMEEGRWREVSQ